MAAMPVAAPSLDVLRLTVQGLVGQLAQTATQLRRARFHGSPDMVSSITDGCALSEVAGQLGGAEAAVRAALGTLEAHMREVDRRVAQDGRV